MTSKSPFARLFRSVAAKPRAEDEDDVLDRKTDDAEDEIAAPDDVEDLKDADGDDAEAKRRKAKKAKKTKADGDDDSDEADDIDAKVRAARARERGRISAIMSSPAAAANPEQALFMALRTSASRETVIADLAAMAPAASRASARARLAGVDVPDVGQGAAFPTGGSALAAQIIAAGKRRRGEI